MLCLVGPWFGNKLYSILFYSILFYSISTTYNTCISIFLIHVLWFTIQPNPEVWSINKRLMDHITHLRNQFKSMDTFEQSYDYIIINISWNRPSSSGGDFLISLMYFCKVWSLIWTNLNPLHLRILFTKVCCNLPSDSIEIF